MATFSDLFNIAGSGAFQGRVAYAMGVAAAAVNSEVNTTTGHAARCAFATKVAAGDYDIQHAALTVLSNPTLAAASVTGQTSPGSTMADSDIQTSVNSLWNLFAGVPS